MTLARTLAIICGATLMSLLACIVFPNASTDAALGSVAGALKGLEDLVSAAWHVVEIDVTGYGADG